MAQRRFFKLCAGGAAVLFTATSGFTGMQMHPLTAHPESENVLAMEVGIVSHPTGQMPAAHRGHHGAHPHSLPGSSKDCTCLGPCQGGGPPTLASPVSVLPLLPQSNRVQVAFAPESPVQRDPTAYLLPLPNAPPLA